MPYAILLTINVRPFTGCADLSLVYYVRLPEIRSFIVMYIGNFLRLAT
jgi:hypothetical protein